MRPIAKLLAAVLLAAAPVSAQIPDPVSAQAPGATSGKEPSDPFAARERVTAADVVVEVRRNVGPTAGTPLPDRLAPADFAVSLDGQPIPVVAVEAPGAEAEPWAVTVYFDLATAPTGGLAWAASALAERAGELARLGPVEVLVADPEPRTAAGPTADPEPLGQALSRLALGIAGRHEVRTLRRELLAELQGSDDAERGEVLDLAARVEAGLVRRSLDHLLATAMAAEAGPRRLLLYLGGGWDLAPAAFYAGHAQASGAVPALVPDPESATAEAAAILAAYGWTVVALAPTDRVEDWNVMRRLNVRMDDNWDPAKAAAFDALGRSLAAQGKLEDAVDAFRSAIHHYYDHPASAKDQAATSARLGEALAAQGKAREAERAYHAALALDPGVVALFPTLAAEVSPLPVLERLASATAGRVARNPEALADALTSLGRRVRLTYQRTGLPDGRLHAIAVTLDKLNYRAEAPQSARSATPEAVAELRLRRLLAGAPPAGDLRLEGALAPPAADGARTLRVRLALAPDDPLLAAGEQALLRLSVAPGDPTAPESPTARPTHQSGEPQSLAGQPAWQRDLPVELRPGETAVAVVVEDLLTGRWGGGLIDLGVGTEP